MFSSLELGPTTPVDLNPDEQVSVELFANEWKFDKWVAHPETADLSESDGVGNHDEGGDND